MRYAMKKAVAALVKSFPFNFISLLSPMTAAYCFLVKLHLRDNI